MDRSPLRCLNRQLESDDLVALYRVADVMLVTPYRDGMNLVCKEYVACGVEDTGALVLSELAGAADELGDQAFTVDPYDLERVKHGIVEAVSAPDQVRRARMSHMRTWLREHDVHRWCTSYLSTLEASVSA